MFFGKILSAGQSYKFSPQQAEENQGEVLSITNVVLAPASKEQVSLFARKDGQEILIATLTRDRPHAVVNLFVSLLDDVTFFTKGNGALHITGFFEPDETEPVPEELEDEQAAEKAQVKVKTTAARPKSPEGKGESAKPLEKKAVAAVAQDEDDDEEDEDFGEDDEEIDDKLDEDDDEDDDQDDEEQQEAPKARPQQIQAKPQQQGKPQGQGQGSWKQQGGKPWEKGGKNFNQQGGKPWQNKQGGKPFNKGGKPFHKN